MGFFGFWLICFVITVIVAASRKLNLAEWFVLGFFFGPLALLLVLITSQKKTQEVTPISTNSSPSSLRKEIEELKAEVNRLLNRLKNLEFKVNGLEIPETPEAAALPSAQAAKEEPARPEKKAAVQEKQDLEVNVGRFWLNRIGIIIFTLGIGFLISYTFRYFGPLAKIISGYAVSLCLFALGLKMEAKERFRNYGRVLLGGAWAIAYFTTYAMYHFDASRIINSQLLGMVLLSAVAFGIIMHSLRYRSQELSAIALLVGYITATIGDINTFTLATCLILSVVTLVLVFKMRWIKLVIFGIAFTYLAHIVWVAKHLYISRVPVSELNVNQVYFLVNSAFLFLYWAVFIAGIHIIKMANEPSEENTLSVANFCNFLFFFLMAFPKFLVFYPQYKFTFVFCLGLIYLGLSLVMEKIRCEKLFVSNIIIALSLLTLAVPLRFIAFHTTVIWLIELPFLVLIGLRFEKPIIRYFAFLLSAVVFLKLLSYDFHLPEVVIISGYGFAWNKVISFLGFISTGICFWFGRAAVKQGKGKATLEHSLNNIYSGLAVIFVTILLWLLTDPIWLTLGLCFEALILSFLGMLLRDRFIRAYSFLVILISAYRFCFLDTYGAMGDVARWAMICAKVLSAYGMYFIFRNLLKRSLLEVYEKDILPVVFVLSTVLFTVAMFKFVSYSWVSLALGLEGVVLFVSGFLVKDKIFRWGGFALFGITIARIVLVDMANLPIIYKIVSFIVLGVLFLGVSFIYTKYTIPKQK